MNSIPWQFLGRTILLSIVALQGKTSSWIWGRITTSLDTWIRSCMNSCFLLNILVLPKIMLRADRHSGLSQKDLLKFCDPLAARGSTL